MMLSFVLRLVPSALADGRLAGTVQTVETGQTTTFRTVEELVLALLPHPRPPQDDGVTIDLRDATRLRVERSDDR
jgi:hypothetical protein